MSVYAFNILYDNSEGYTASGEEESDGGEGKRKMSRPQHKACPVKDDTLTSSDSGPEVNNGPSNRKPICNDDHPNFMQNEPKPFIKNASDSDNNVCEITIEAIKIIVPNPIAGYPSAFQLSRFQLSRYIEEEDYGLREHG